LAKSLLYFSIFLDILLILSGKKVDLLNLHSLKRHENYNVQITYNMSVVSVGVKKKWYRLETSTFEVSPDRVKLLQEETILLHQMLWL
jgi:hypothetical protein